MFKVKEMIMMLCLILSGAFCYANGTAEAEKKGDGTPISVIEKTCHGGGEKGSSILPILNGHMLTVTFTENLGEVTVEITSATGGNAQADCKSAGTKGLW